MKYIFFSLLLFVSISSGVVHAQDKSGNGPAYQQRLLEDQQKALQALMKEQQRLQNDILYRQQMVSRLEGELARTKMQQEHISIQAGIPAENSREQLVDSECSSQIEVMASLEHAGVTKPVARANELIDGELSRVELTKTLKEKFYMSGEDAARSADKIVWIRKNVNRASASARGTTCTTCNYNQKPMPERGRGVK